MTVDELYNHITKDMTPEQALRMLLSTHVEQYQEMRDMLSRTEEDGGSPIMIIAAATLDLGWQLKVKDEEYVNGLICGNKEFMERAMITDLN